MSTINSQLGTVSFQGHDLTVITTDSGERFVAMKPVCEAIGLAWNGQYERIKRHEVLKEGIRVIRTPSTSGIQEFVCLPLDYLNGWLFGVDASRVKPEIRERLIQYQRECFGVLAAYWQRGKAVNPRKPRRPRLAPALDLDYPVSRWLGGNPLYARYHLDPGSMFITADMFFDQRSPTLSVLAELKRAGYDVEACYLEVQGMRHHLEVSRDFVRTLHQRSGEALNQGMRIKRW
ncbi:phage antirepressor N-terminal domain-containing protein [Azotobacter vinelandii]|uniref:phage antirepressor N-terminal domain-containing protein n=1 Tax=Azotobacter vinelandii TaxID=354 RepID=UPI000772DAEC|nr:phage antirepressor N-terminal domain-containing protein [Azotobacter vinelandii]